MAGLIEDYAIIGDMQSAAALHMTGRGKEAHELFDEPVVSGLGEP